MLLGQTGVDRLSHHAPGPMPKPLDLGEGGFPRRSCRSKAMPCQQCHQFAELLFSLQSVPNPRFQRPCSS
jgi:hypothetical protein